MVDFTMWKDRLRAGGIHFLFSLIVVLLFWLIARFLLYPGVFSKLGLYDGFSILFWVDLILGPLLTTIIYDARKKSLKFDLSVIVLLQLCAFIFGATLVYSQKPCVMVLSNSGLTVHTMSDCGEYEIDGRFRSRFGPVPMVFLDLPQNLTDVNTIQFITEFVEGKPLTARSDLYVEIDDLTDEQFKFYFASKEYLEKESCFVVPIVSEHADGNICIDVKSGNAKALMN